jgi:hypothetical protein
VRAAGGRAARRTATKAQPAGVRAASAPLAEQGAGEEADDIAPPADDLPGTELTATASRVPASSVRPGPRQQPRRSGGPPRHRPAGKKKRR